MVLEKGLEMFEKIINKLFFKRIGFKLFVVFTFFIGIGIFFFMCSNYRNPYYKNIKYNNMIEFVESSIEPELAYDSPFDYAIFEYNRAFVIQAAQKGIISGSVSKIVNNFALGQYLLLEQVYACSPEKLNNFLLKHMFDNGYDYPYSINDELYSEYKLSIDCEKAKNLSLAPEHYYFFKYDFWAIFIGSFIYIPLILLILWTTLRFIIISPILWICKKD